MTQGKNHSIQSSLAFILQPFSRMPTLSGLRRRCVPPSAMRLFCERVGSDALLDYTEFENCIREVIDDASTRAFAVLDPYCRNLITIACKSISK